MRVFSIKNDYVEYLKKFDNRVFNNKDDYYNFTRKYLGIVISLSSYKYYIPFSSPKEKDYFYVDGIRKIRKSTNFLIRMVSNENRLLGTLQISNMIPVTSESLIEYDLSKESNVSYKELVNEELKFIRKNIDEIVKKANIVYKQKVRNYKNINYIHYCVDFLKCEKACESYKNSPN